MTRFINFLILIVFNAYTVNVFAADDTTKVSVGEERFKKTCVTCHSSSMAKMMKAPQVHTADWLKFTHDAVLDSAKLKTTNCSALTKNSADPSKLSVSDDEVKTLSSSEKACYLLPIAKSGKLGMPPSGTCTDCSDDELTETIKFMVTQQGG